MAASLFLELLLLLSQFYVFSSAHLQSNKNGFISLSVSEKGLDFVKDLLIDKAVSSLTPLELPQIEKYVKIPLVGRVHIILSDIIIYHIDVPSSIVKSGEAAGGGVLIDASGATANLTMNWKYYYKTWFIKVSDKGNASVQVGGMEVGLISSMKDQEGSLKLSLLECGCSIKDIEIDLGGGGASWLYQGLVDAFSKHIESAVEDAIVKKLKEGISKIDSLLQSVPKEITVGDISALNVTLVDDPIFTDYSVDFEINGLFMPTAKVLISNYYHENSRASETCDGQSKMVAISLDEEVFNSASLIYFNVGLMQWTIRKIPDQSILNTADWRYLIPQLYEKFPNDDMILNVSVSSSPIIKVSDGSSDITIYSDVTIRVLDNGEATPVACISLVVTASGSAEISRNNLTGSIRLDNFTLSSKWSKIGDLPLHLIQPVISTVLKTVLLPRLNSHLMHGFPLPLFHGIELQNAEIFYTKSKITVCSDAAYAENHTSFWPSNIYRSIFMSSL